MFLFNRKKLWLGLLLGLSAISALPYGIGWYVRTQYFQILEQVNRHVESISSESHAQISLKNIEYKNQYYRSLARTEMTVIDKKTNSSYHVILNHDIFQGPVIIESLKKISFQLALVNTSLSSDEPWFQGAKGGLEEFLKDVIHRVILDFKANWVLDFSMPATKIPDMGTHTFDWGGFDFHSTLSRKRDAIQTEFKLPKLDMQDTVKGQKFLFQDFTVRVGLHQSMTSGQWFGETTTHLGTLSFQDKPPKQVSLQGFDAMIRAEEQGELANQNFNIAIAETNLLGYILKPMYLKFQLNQLNVALLQQFKQKQLGPQDWTKLLVSRPSFVLEEFLISLPEGSDYPEWNGSFKANGTVSIGGPSVENVTQVNLLLSTLEANAYFSISKNLLTQILREKISADMKKEALAQLSKTPNNPPENNPNSVTVPQPEAEETLPVLTTLTPEQQIIERDRRVTLLLADLVKTQILIEQSEQGQYVLQLAYRQNQLLINGQPLKDLPAGLL